jgi:N-acetylneuraminate lyase
MSPSYFKLATVKELVDFCVPIAAEVEPLPFYYYHIPSMTGVRLPMSEFLYEARFRIPNLRGLKFSHDDLVDLQGCISLEKGAYDILFGFDEALLAGLCMGVRGAVGCTYNFAGRHYLRLIRAFESGDIAAARAAQLTATELVKTLASFGFMAASKAVMALIGVDCGPVRAPLRNLTPAQVDELAGRLSAFDLFERPLSLKC